MGIASRYAKVCEELEQACLDADRPADSALLLAVSKTVGIEGVSDAITAGATDFGENRPEQLMEKHAVYPNVRWHFIGNIQSRRIPDIVSHAHLIHSLHTLRHAEKIDHVAADLGKVQDVLIEVNVSGEESKSGVAPAEALGLVQACAALPHVRVRGLMTMAPQGDLGIAQKCFEDLASLREEIASKLDAEHASSFDQLSAGMSEDWESAIAAGSTMVRIGRAIFSASF